MSAELTLQAVLQSLSSPKHQKLHGTFAAMKPFADLSQSHLTLVAKIERLASTLAELFQTVGQMADDVAVALAIALHKIFQFQAQFRPGHLFASIDAADVLAEQIAGNANEPGTQQALTIKPGSPQISPKKNLLREVFGIVGLQETRAEIPKDRRLMRADDRFKGGSVASLGSVNQLAVVHSGSSVVLTT